jgi:1,2-dihydroxy-3-keto-5-methylthiopentene dioxygenase
MAILQLEDGNCITNLEAIAQELAPLGVQLHHWAVGDDTHLQQLLAQAALEDSEKEQVLVAFDHYFHNLQQTANYQSRDLIVLHPDIPNLEALLIKFAQIHTHADDEVRYVVDGEGVFGFVRPDDSQIRLTIQSEEYINVPAGTEHWFYLTPTRRIKAIRYFTDTVGWTPHYTGREIRNIRAAQTVK